MVIYITKKKKYAYTANELIENIINSENVEIYTFDCPSFYQENYTYSNNRSFRFLPLLDTIEQDEGDDQLYGVNLSITREADGIVSNLDCLNIKSFQLSNKIFYTPIFFTHDINSVRYKSYSLWLTFYKLMHKEFFSKYNNIYDILAGIFACSLKIKENIYYLHAEKLSDFAVRSAALPRRSRTAA